MGTLHSLPGRESMDLARFTARTEAFVFAAERSDPSSLVFLQQGEGENMRARARADLMCPEPGCTAPGLTTVFRSPGGRRDGYKHHTSPVGGAHAVESVMHRQAKALLHRWAQNLDAVAEVQVEAPIAGGERVADVLLTSHTGNRLAIEVQYSNQPLSAFVERSESYRAAGIELTWLFGSIGSMSPLDKALRPGHQWVLDSDQPLMWINPVEETVGWLAHASEPRPMTSDNYRNSEVRFFDVTAFDLRARGIFPPEFITMRETWRAASAQEEAERADQQRVEDERVRQHREQNRQRLTPTTDSLATPAAPVKLRCRNCGLPLDPILARSGVHLGDCTNAHW